MVAGLVEHSTRLVSCDQAAENELSNKGLELTAS
jgi:hypothetical protein